MQSEEHDIRFRYFSHRSYNQNLTKFTPVPTKEVLLQLLNEVKNYRGR